jgi:hypothetical protein
VSSPAGGPTLVRAEIPIPDPGVGGDAGDGAGRGDPAA